MSIERAAFSREIRRRWANTAVPEYSDSLALSTRRVKHSGFHLGLGFVAAAGLRWRCTDVGTRTVVATPLDHDDPIRYQGPPYIAREVVFDEAEMAGCYLSELELLEDRLAKAAKSAHPNFSSEDFFRMSEERTEEKPRYPNRGVLRFDRLREDGEILHPYSA
jgi:hypothetical protein